MAAAWAAVASWTEQTAKDRLLDAAGALPAKARILVGDQQPPVTITDPATVDLAAGLRMAPGSLRTRLAAARTQTARTQAQVPVLGQAVRDGLLGAWPAALVLQDTMHLASQEQLLVVDLLVATLRARHDDGLTPWTLPEICREVQRICARLDLDLRAARQRAHASRQVRLRSYGCAPGMAQLIADLPADVAQRIWQRLTAITDGIVTDEHHAGDPPAAETRCAPTSTPTCCWTTPPPPAPRSTRTVRSRSSSTPMSCSARPTGPPKCPASDPFPPRSPGSSRQTADGGSGSLIPGNGQMIATNASTYRPSSALARLLRARDAYCRMPGCRRPSSDCQLDHAINYPAGKTSAENMGPLCERDHNVKTHLGWSIDVHDDGTYTWASPTGITYPDRSGPPLPDHAIADW